MNIFAVRLNPDPRMGLPYSEYPTAKVYKEIHAEAVMDGFHEAVNFLSEQGVVRGYLPPKHLLSIRTPEPFLLITVTAKEAKSNGNMIFGIQAGCKYVGENIRSGGSHSTKKLGLTYYYSCPASLSVLFDKPLSNARTRLMENGRGWGQGPTYEIKSKQKVIKVLNAAIKEGCINKNDKEVKSLLKWIDGKISLITEYEVDSIFDDEVTQIVKAGKLLRTQGNESPEQKEVTTYQYVRNPKVAAYALLMAKGICHDCKKEGPFISRTTNRPFLEVHHVKTLKDGGSDTIKNVIALCPNCHRKRHDDLARVWNE